MVVTRNQLDDLQDRLFEIRQLADSAGRDLADGLSAASVLHRLLAGIEAELAGV
ncbi:MAG: hypothetical protein R2698_11365 [Microthrixaceae bacterium]